MTVDWYAPSTHANNNNKNNNNRFLHNDTHRSTDTPSTEIRTILGYAAAAKSVAPQRSGPCVARSTLTKWNSFFFICNLSTFFYDIRRICDVNSIRTERIILIWSFMFSLSHIKCLNLVRFVFAVWNKHSVCLLYFSNNCSCSNKSWSVIGCHYIFSCVSWWLFCL